MYVLIFKAAKSKNFKISSSTATCGQQSRGAFEASHRCFKPEAPRVNIPMVSCRRRCRLPAVRITVKKVSNGLETRRFDRVPGVLGEYLAKLGTPDLRRYIPARGQAKVGHDGAVHRIPRAALFLCL